MHRLSRWLWHALYVFIGCFVLYSVFFLYQNGAFSVLFSQVVQRFTSQELQLTAEVSDPVAGLVHVEASFEPLQMDVLEGQFDWCISIDYESITQELHCQDSFDVFIDEIILPDGVSSFEISSTVVTPQYSAQSEVVVLEWTPEVSLSSPQGDVFAPDRSILYQPVYILKSRSDVIEVVLDDSPLPAQRVVQADEYPDALLLSHSSIVVNNWFVPMPPEETLAGQHSLCLRMSSNEECYFLSERDSAFSSESASYSQPIPSSRPEPDFAFTEMTSDQVFVYVGVEDPYDTVRMVLRGSTAEPIAMSSSVYDRSFLQSLLDQGESFVLDYSVGTELRQSYLFEAVPPFTVTSVSRGSADNADATIDAIDIVWQGSGFSELSQDKRFVIDTSERQLFDTVLVVTNDAQRSLQLRVSVPTQFYSVVHQIAAQEQTDIPIVIDSMDYGLHRLEIVSTLGEVSSEPLVYTFEYQSDSFIGAEPTSKRIVVFVLGFVLVIFLFSQLLYSTRLHSSRP